MSLAFPLRLRENGLLQRQNTADAVISMLQVMARTPAGSWAGCPSFGLRDLFENGRQRADVARLAMERINETFRELGMETFSVSEVIRELSPGRDTDTYSITVEQAGGRDGFTTLVSHGQ